MPMSQYTRCLVCLINCLRAARTSLQLIDGGGTWWAIYCSWAEPWPIFYRTSNSILSWQAINKQASKQRASKSGNQASKGVFCLLACLSASLHLLTFHISAPPHRDFEARLLQVFEASRGYSNFWKRRRLTRR